MKYILDNDIIVGINHEEDIDIVLDTDLNFGVDKLVNGELVKFPLQILPTEEEINNRKELTELLSWFDKYDRIAIEHARCMRMGTICHHDIEALDKQAVINQTRIAELKKLLSK